jgi:hypothetical protein
MRRAWRAPIVVLACVAGAAAIVVACTTFDGAVATEQDASTDDVFTVDVHPETAPVEAGAPGYLPTSEAARLCSLLFKCPYLATSIIDSLAVPADGLNYSLCMHWLSGPIPPDRVGMTLQSQALACMAAATTCVGAGACVWDENIAPNDPRCADASAPDGGDRCGDDGGTVYACAAGLLVHCDSAYFAPGTHCLPGADGFHYCALDTNCTVLDSCINTLNDFCGVPSNLHFGLNCAYAGYTCGLAVNDDSGLNGCFTGNMDLQCNSPGTSCAATDSGPPTVLQVCDGLDLSNFNCAALGVTCSTNGGAAICTHPGDTCTPSDNGENKCNGSSISLCVGGHPATFDCASIGMSCVPASGSTSGHCG